MRRLLFYLLPILFVVLSIGFCGDYVIKMARLKNVQIGTAGDVTRSEYEDKTNGYYTITYDLDGGTIEVENPTKYNLFTENFTLNNPVKLACKFLGWTGPNLTEPKLSVTICKGSSGDLEFKANYEVLLATPVLSINDNIITFNAITNAEYYELCINNDNSYYSLDANSCSFDVSNYSYNFKPGINEFKIRACCTYDNKLIYSAFSNIVNYECTETKQLATPELISLENNILTWSIVPNCFDYQICLDGSPFYTISKFSAINGKVCRFDISLLKDSISSGNHSITIYADNNGEYLRSEQSNSFDFSCTYFADVTFSMSSWPFYSCAKCLQPFSSAGWVCSNCGEEVTVTWNEVPNADKYYIEISDFDDQNIKVKTFYTTNENRAFKFSDFSDCYTSGHRYVLGITPISNSMNYVYYPKGISNNPLYYFS